MRICQANLLTTTRDVNSHVPARPVPLGAGISGNWGRLGRRRTASRSVGLPSARRLPVGASTPIGRHLCAPVEVAGTIPRYRIRLPYKGSRWRRHAGRRGQTIETNPFGAIIIPRGNDKGSATQAPEPGELGVTRRARKAHMVSPRVQLLPNGNRRECDLVSRECAKGNALLLITSSRGDQPRRRARTDSGSTPGPRSATPPSPAAATLSPSGPEVPSPRDRCA
jgi:hypothetical protein